MVKVRALGPVNVCVFCGTDRPEIPSPSCAHGETAKVEGFARQAAARLFLDRQRVESSRIAFATALEAELRAGRATVDPCPPVRYQGSNVAFLQDREIRSDELQPVRVG